VDDWLSSARDRVAEAAGEEREGLGLSQAEIDDLLELARIAAHESGERVNAPLLCYLVGVARGRTGTDLEELVDAAVGKPI
jgi:hypothetical protein